MQHHWTLIVIGIAVVLYAFGWIGGSYLGLAQPITIFIFMLTYLAAGYDLALETVPALFKGKLNTDLLMLLAAMGAAALGEWREGAFLLVLFGLGHAGEHYAVDRARNAIRAMGNLPPKTALTRRDHREVELPVEQLQLGDRVIVKPGTRLAADGIVRVGESWVDQAPITGESIPVEKSLGDSVFAGSINGEGALEIEVTRLTQDNTLARIIRMVEEAESQQSPTQQRVERFERIFVPTVLIGTLLMILLPPLFFSIPFQVSFSRAMMLLVAASPCALALGTPSAILAGIAQAARNGVLIKGGVHLENLGRLKALALDKTGTLTEGRPRLTDLISVSGTPTDQLLAWAAGLEQRSAHPLAQAILRAAEAKNIEPATFESVDSLTGRGLKGQLNGQTMWLGNLRLLETAHIPLSEQTRKSVEQLESAGKTCMLLVMDQTVIGIIGVADKLRPNALAALQSLRKMGVEKMILLTGDNPVTAARIAERVGIQEVRANLMPADKADAIKALTQQYGVIGMIGDGVNDAPALAHATIGIAMGGAGTAVALETADVALMGDDLSKVAFAVGLGRATGQIITQNLAIALGVIALLIFSTLFGFTKLGITVLLHEGSTLVVVFNSLRLLTFGGESGAIGAKLFD
jgi:Cd2+/Zn2+-exporting ATPase